MALVGHETCHVPVCPQAFHAADSICTTQPPTKEPAGGDKRSFKKQINPVFFKIHLYSLIRAWKGSYNIRSLHADIITFFLPDTPALQNHPLKKPRKVSKDMSKITICETAWLFFFLDCPFCWLVIDSPLYLQNTEELSSETQTVFLLVAFTSLKRNRANRKWSLGCSVKQII